MRLDPVFLFFFALYCLEAGLFFTLAPWNPGWERVVYELPVAPVRGALLTPVVRGAITGFGLVHLLWGLHDFRLLALRRRQARLAQPTQPTQPTQPAPSARPGQSGETPQVPVATAADERR